MTAELSGLGWTTPGGRSPSLSLQGVQVRGSVLGTEYRPCPCPSPSGQTAKGSHFWPSVCPRMDEPKVPDQSPESVHGPCQPPAAAPVCVGQASISCCLGARCGVPTLPRVPPGGGAAAGLPARARSAPSEAPQDPQDPLRGTGPVPLLPGRVPEGTDAPQPHFLPNPGEADPGPQHPRAPGAQPPDAQHPDVHSHGSPRPRPGPSKLLVR